MNRGLEDTEFAIKAAEREITNQTNSGKAVDGLHEVAQASMEKTEALLKKKQTEVMALSLKIVEREQIIRRMKVLISALKDPTVAEERKAEYRKEIVDARSKYLGGGIAALSRGF